jgi:PAS domain S-box-containing protein
MKSGKSLRSTSPKTGEVSPCLDIPRKDTATRKNSAKMLAVRANELEVVFRMQTDAIIICDARMRISRANPAFHTQFGFDPVGVDIDDVFRRMSCRGLDEKPISSDSKSMPLTRGGDRATGLHLTATRPDGTDVAIEVSLTPVRAEEGVTGWAMVWHDILKQQHAEDALLRARVQLEDRIEEMAQIVRSVLVNPSRGRADWDAPSLTSRETRVLSLIAKGKPSGAIAEQLLISVHTVNRHRANIMAKLKVTKDAELVRYAILHGLAVR